MNYDWLIRWWEHILTVFLIVMILFDLVMIAFVIGLAVSHRILRRAVRGEIPTVEKAHREAVEIRIVQSGEEDLKRFIDRHPMKIQ